MLKSIVSLVVLISACADPIAQSADPIAQTNALPALPKQTGKLVGVAIDKKTSEPRRQLAIRSLRAMGKPGLHAALTTHQYIWTALRRRVIDEVSGQKYGHISKLFWHTDIEAARDQSQRTRKPILSLRMLGKLTDEYSCANSRLFRVVLYADLSIAKILDEQYILHWSTERPVPQVKIDFGDGRKLQTTVTGNSIHYIMNSELQIIDALPGLYRPDEFAAALRKSASLFHAITDNPAVLISHHKQEITQAVALARKAGVAIGDSDITLIATPAFVPSRVPASKAIDIAVTKGFIERPIVTALDIELTRNQKHPIWTAPWDEVLPPAKPLSDSTRKLIARHVDPTDRATVDSSLLRLLTIDTGRNEYVLRPALRQWIIDGRGKDWEAFNAAVYKDLFKTPASDPWLGLVRDDAYTGLPKDDSRTTP